MGAQSLQVMRGLLDFDRALAWHLQYNCYPPIPSVRDAAIEAIAAAKDGEWEREIELPEGILFRGSKTAPVSECIKGWHLEGFLEDDPDEPA